jgi:endoplasmic reticulum chaperone BiP
MLLIPFLLSPYSEVFSTNYDNQSSVTIQVYEGERSMTKDNHQLGQFQLSGIPPAPRGVPQIEVSFQIDVNGILLVSALDKATGKSEKVTITADQNRLSQDEIDRMIAAAKEHEEEDRMLKDRIDAKNGLESYLYNLRNTLEDKEDGGGLPGDVSFEDKKELLDLIDETLDWLGDNPDSDKESYVDKLKEMEQIANPVIRKAYGSSSSSGGGGDDMEDYADEEL